MTVSTAKTASNNKLLTDALYQVAIAVRDIPRRSGKPVWVGRLHDVSCGKFKTVYANTLLELLGEISDAIIARHSKPHDLAVEPGVSHVS